MVDNSDHTHVAAPTIAAVDTTGAGDAFRAALAVGIVAGLDMAESVRRAVRVGAAACLRPGAQPSMPTAAEVDELLENA